MILRSRKTSSREQEEDGTAGVPESRSDDMVERRRARSKLAKSPEERRRKILDRGNERMHLILGRTPPNNVEETAEIPAAESSPPYVPESPPPYVPESISPYVPDTLRRFPEVMDIREEIKTDQPVNNWPAVPYALVLFIYAIVVKLIYIFVLPRHLHLRYSSYIVPFIVIELGNILYDFASRCQDDDLGGMSFVRMTWIQLFLELCLNPTLQVIGHFPMYFLPLCLLENLI